MALSYPLAMPGSPKPERATMMMPNRVQVTRPPFGITERLNDLEAGWWEVALSYPPMKRATAAAWVRWLVGMRGRRGTTEWGPEWATSPRGSVAGTPVVDGGSQTGTTLATRGWDASETGVLLGGDYIQLTDGSGNKRLHMVTQDADSDGSGEASVEIWPALRFSPSDGDSIVTSSPQGTFRLQDNPSFDVGRAALYGLGFNLVEAVR